MKFIQILILMCFSSSYASSAKKQQDVANQDLALNTSYTFHSAIHTGSLTQKLAPYKPYILLSSNDDLIATVNCTDSGSGLFKKNNARINLCDKMMVTLKNFNATAFVQIESDECIQTMNSLVEGKIKLQLNVGSDVFENLLNKSKSVKDSTFNILRL